MYVKVENAESVTLCDEDDLTRFSVQVPKDSSAETISSHLMQTGAGRLDGDEAAVSIEWLRQHTASRSQQWRSNYSHLIARDRAAHTRETG